MEQASGELMQAAFSRRVLRDGLTQSERLAEAEHVLNEFGQCQHTLSTYSVSLSPYNTLPSTYPFNTFIQHTLLLTYTLYQYIDLTYEIIDTPSQHAHSHTC